MSSIFLDPSDTRLVTIAAHVDHGKTTLADNLIQHNGLISERLAGTIRYLDSDPEEQRRGITMRSSAIGLSHQYQAPKQTQQAASGPRILHLVDSPGHTDFSLEVSSALTACDACLLVVDAVEGMGPRTHQVVREAMFHDLVPILVINKMDRLWSDLGLSATEAYLRIRALLESVNAAAAAMSASAAAHVVDQGSDQTNPHDDGSRTTTTSTTSGNAPITKKENTNESALWTFDPAKGNVLFGSALFGWGFTVASLARSLYKHHLVSIKPVLLRPYLFGDYKLKGQDKVVKWKFSTGKDSEDNVPLFAQFGLQPLWDIYQGVATAASAVGQSTVFLGPASINHNNLPTSNNTTTATTTNNNHTSSSKLKADTPGMELVLQSLSVGWTGDESSVITSTEQLQALLTRTGSTTADAVLRCILRRYRPLASTVLDVVCEYGPSPLQAAAQHRVSLQPPVHRTEEWSAIQQAVQRCDTSRTAPTVAHVCKFFSTPRANVREGTAAAVGSSSLSKEGDHVILGLTRVLSGRLQTGTEYYVLGPKYQPPSSDGSSSSSSSPPPKRTIQLFLLMGSSFVLVPEVPAGHLCAVLNLDTVQLKHCCLSDRVHATPLKLVEHSMRPLVKVNVEAESSEDANELDRALLQLSCADAAIEVTATARGERILACLGEIHLEQSILDLQHVYCSRPIGLRTSDPIVDFGETTDWFPKEVALEYTAFCQDASTPPPRQATIPPYNEEEGLTGAKLGRARAVVSGRSAALSLRVVPLTDLVHKCLQTQSVEPGSHDELVQLGKALGLGSSSGDDPQPDAAHILQRLLDSVCSVGTNGTALMESPHLQTGSTIFGVQSDESGQVYMAHNTDPSIQASSDTHDKDDDNDEHHEPLEELHSPPGQGEYNALQHCIRDGSQATHDLVRTASLDEAAVQIWNKLKGSAVAGFQMALRSGPICEEQVRNILVVLEGFEIAMTPAANQEGDDATWQPAKSLSSGMIVSALRSGIRCALLTRPARLMEGYLRLTLNSSLNGLGSLYSVLSKRRGKVEDDSMVDGTDLLAITALIPQAEAFGLAPELYSKTSGEVTAPEMIFSHWQRLDVDPFWIPTTEEEREDYGELQVAGDSSTGMDNTALRYIRKVRERKGLKIDSSRTVVAAEKQRTLKR